VAASLHSRDHARAYCSLPCCARRRILSLVEFDAAQKKKHILADAVEAAEAEDADAAADAEAEEEAPEIKMSQSLPNLPGVTSRPGTGGSVSGAVGTLPEITRKPSQQGPL
jgi:hypothetical protein